MYKLFIVILGAMLSMSDALAGKIVLENNFEACIYGPPNKENFVFTLKSGKMTGTATLITDDGLFLSALHVIHDSEDVIILDKNNNPHSVTIIKMYPKHDLVLLGSNNFTKGQALPFYLSDNTTKEIMLTWAVGYIDGELKGNAGHTFPHSSNSEKLALSSRVREGMSGGAVVACENQEFRLMGIITSYGLVRAPNPVVAELSYAVNVSTLLELISEL